MQHNAPIIVIGPGHNGLTAAARLSASGHRVMVFEQRSVLGGIAATESLLPETAFNTGFSNVSALLPEITTSLHLKQNGFTLPEPKTALFAASPGGGGFALDAARRPLLH